MAIRGVRSWLVLPILAGGAYAAYWAYETYFSGAGSTERLVNQVWVARKAAGPRDVVPYVILVDDEGRRAGVTGQASRWRSWNDVFLWGLDRDLLRVRFPQDERQGQVRVRTWKCAGDAPAPFDWCLSLQGRKHTAHFYSRSQWIVKPHKAFASDADLGELDGAMAAALGLALAAPAKSVGESTAAEDFEWPTATPEAPAVPATNPSGTP
jgi:hypothetical protein